MKSYKYILFFSIISGLLSCTSTDKLSPVVKYSLSTLNATHGKLRTDGYYIRYEQDDSITYVYKDMFLIYGDGTIRCAYMDDRAYGMSNIDLSKALMYQGRWMLSANESGIYRINEQNVMEAELFGKAWVLGRVIHERWYMTVVDSTTIELCGISFLRDGVTINRELGYRYMFVPAHSIPPPDVYAKRKKYLWESVAEWKAYMADLKVRRKQRETEKNVNR